MSRFTYCNCPAGFGAGAERHAPDCPGRQLDRPSPTPVPETTGRYGCTCDCFAGAPGHSVDCPMFTPIIKPQHFGASKPQINVSGYEQQLFQPGDPFAEARKVWEELLRNTREQQADMQEVVVLNALGMTKAEALANRHRISRHVHPDQDIVLLDGEPVVAIHQPVIRGDELVTTYQLLRKTS